MKLRAFRSLIPLLALAALAGDPRPASAGDEAGSSAGARETGIDLRAVRQRGQSMPIDARVDMDKRIAATVERVNRRASEQGQSAVATRLAAEFSVPREALLDVKGTHGWSWGDVMIAYTLLANTPPGAAPSDLASLRSEGLGWAAIAYGLQFRMEDFEEAIKAQGRVAMGWSKADGKAETIGR
jgi:hypothetical protein